MQKLENNIWENFNKSSIFLYVCSGVFKRTFKVAVYTHDASLGGLLREILLYTVLLAIKNVNIKNCIAE